MSCLHFEGLQSGSDCNADHGVLLFAFCSTYASILYKKEHAEKLKGRPTLEAMFAKMAEDAKKFEEGADDTDSEPTTLAVS